MITRQQFAATVTCHQLHARRWNRDQHLTRKLGNRTSVNLQFLCLSSLSNQKWIGYPLMRTTIHFACSVLFQIGHVSLKLPFCNWFYEVTLSINQKIRNILEFVSYWISLCIQENLVIYQCKIFVKEFFGSIMSLISFSKIFNFSNKPPNVLKISLSEDIQENSDTLLVFTISVP